MTLQSKQKGATRGAAATRGYPHFRRTCSIFLGSIIHILVDLHENEVLCGPQSVAVDTTGIFNTSSNRAGQQY
jgi:hypothetical protein